MDEVGGIDEADDSPGPPGLPQTGPQLVIEELRLLIRIGLGRDHPQLAELQAHPLEELSDLGQAPADARDPLDRGGGLAGGAGRVLAEVVLQGAAVLVQFALGPSPVDPLEPLDAPLLELSQLARISHQRNGIGLPCVS